MVEKKIKGRKRHIVTDTAGNLLHVEVGRANEHDTKAGCSVFEKAIRKYPTVQGVCVDAGYRKTTEQYVTNVLNKKIEISSRISPGWAIAAKRWVVERTFAWLNSFRRLSKDYEISTASVESFIMIAFSMILLKRLGS